MLTFYGLIIVCFFLFHKFVMKCKGRGVVVVVTSVCVESPYFSLEITELQSAGMGIYRSDMS